MTAREAGRGDEGERREPTVAKPALASSPVGQEMERLASLRTAGFLSDEELTVLKGRLIGG